MITIVTVVFNGEKTIERCIQSVLGQNFSDLEYIIIDGGSTDQTISTIKKYEEKISYFISEPDKGVYDAMNKALHLANGDWVFFLGADDELIPGAIKKCAKIMTKKNNLYYGDVFIPDINKIYNGKFSKYNLMQSNICHQSIFYPKTIYKSYKYKKYFKIFADYYMNLMLIGIGVKFTYLNETVAIFNLGGISSRQDIRFNKIKEKAIKKYLGLNYFLLKKIRNFIVGAVKCCQ